MKWHGRHVVSNRQQLDWLCSSSFRLTVESTVTLPIADPLWMKSTSKSPTQRDRHDDVIKWKHFPRNWPFVREIHRSPVNFPHKGQWRGALMFSLIYAWINDWVNNREAGDLRLQHGHYDVIVMNAEKSFCHDVIMKCSQDCASRFGVCYGKFPMIMFSTGLTGIDNRGIIP